MAGTSYTCQLYESEGIAKIIVFSGLDFDLIIHPYVYGEPLVTLQPVYFLEQLGSIAKLEVEHPKKISELETEYLIDNYLFEYSLIHDSSRLCSKINTPAFWAPDFSDLYQYHDQRRTRALTLDPLNDDSIISIQDLNGKDWPFTDYCIPKEFIDDALKESATKILDLHKQKLIAMINLTSERDGYYGKLRLLENEGDLIDFTQAVRFDYISEYSLKDKVSYELSSDIEHGNSIELPIERVTATEKYSPTLLSFYFSGLRERNPLISFTGFYNVLEYYLEEAPVILGIQPLRTERENLQKVVELLTDQSELYTKLNSLSSKSKTKLQNDIISSSRVKIKGLRIINRTSLIKDISDWLYGIRCAVVHSKKSRKGKVEAIFEPYSKEVDNITPALEVIKWLAQKCIIKDNTLSNNAT
ncbi:hypothetical protein ACQIBV_002885 [Yersinia enterocolitica]|nr:hypothetical protein [Yersinia enterocolitica]EKN3502033.1 hypothetical protein [Yersinia enterocolitica]EKN4062932.1 hypothetical protein [Yersinia enterocolitica]EKN4159524.1 hypothetical protein [Yersinia enterocolitica]EKN4862012.1 hypothetical protein [Yersinia enterocolitica]